MKEKKVIDIIELFSTVLGEKVKKFDLPPPSFTVMKGEIIAYDKEKKTLLTKMPLFGKVYKFCVDVLKAIFGSKEKIFEEGVLVSFPMEDIRCIGLKLTKIPPQFIEKSKKNLTAVLVLTAPHPIAGYLLYYPEDQLKTLNASVESVMRYSVSMGTILN